ncbi:hypothetical protein CC2G_008308 [Coprinopsis cinerea AmutBmut pab1-1]|nr:hypothetical protein CC2G_008308 [Coprinopsis cinerea AmutBmut pab1-1]
MIKLFRVGIPQGVYGTLTPSSNFNFSNVIPAENAMEVTPQIYLEHLSPIGVMDVYLDPSSGSVTGIPDWEQHSLQPGVLAADYPEWLLFEGAWTHTLGLEICGGWPRQTNPPSFAMSTIISSRRRTRSIMIV